MFVVVVVDLINVGFTALYVYVMCMFCIRSVVTLCGWRVFNISLQSTTGCFVLYSTCVIFELVKCPDWGNLVRVTEL